MGGLFNDIVAFVARTDVQVRMRTELGHATGADMQEGAILSAAAVFGGFARSATDPSFPGWLETELRAVDSSLGSVMELSSSTEFDRFGRGGVNRLFGAGQNHVADHVAASSGLTRDGGLTVLAASAWITIGHLARRQEQGEEVDGLISMMQDDERDLRAAGWGPWIDTALDPPDEYADGIGAEGSHDRSSAGPGDHLEQSSMATGDASLARTEHRSKKRSRWPTRIAALALLAVAAAVVSAVVFWSPVSDQDESAVAESAAAPSTTVPSTTIDDDAQTASDEPEPDDEPAVIEVPDAADEAGAVEVPDMVMYSLELSDPQGRSDAVGDLELMVNTVSGEVCYEFETTGLATPYVAHIHIGAAAGAGGITVDFGLLESTDSGCVQAHPADLVAVATRPTVRYVEAHDPSGAFTIRAQLTAPDSPEPAPEPLPEIADRAHLVITAGSVVLRGAVADQDILDAFVDSYSDLEGNGIEVVNELRISPEAEAPTTRVIVEGSVRFEFDSTEISEESEVFLTGLVEVLKTRPEWTVALLGHTDSSGKAFYNFSLSLRRAQAVQRAMIELGLPELTATVEGFGPLVPSADNETTDGRAANRRIDFVVDPGV